MSQKKEALLFQSTIVYTFKAHAKAQKTPKFRTECQGPSKEIKKYRKKPETYDLIKILQLPSAKTWENGILSVFSVVTFFGLKKTACRQRC